MRKLNVFFDVDNTLIMWNGKLRNHTRHVFEELRSAGHTIYIWSGVGIRRWEMRRHDLDEFVECFNPANRHERKRTWTEKRNPDGRWRGFDYEELTKRDKVNLDIFWLKDKSLEDSEDLPEPDVLAQEIADDLQTALDQFTVIAGELKD